MKTNVLKNECMDKILSLGTIKELSEYITKMLQKNKEDFHFPNFDLAIADEFALEKYKKKINYLEEVYNASCGWYGMKEINTDFDSEDSILSIVSDYYGGGCANILNLWYGDFDDLSCTKEIMRVLINTMEIQEGNITENTIVIVDWDKDKFIKM